MAEVMVSLAPIIALGSPLEVKILNAPEISSNNAMPLETPMAICKILLTKPVGSVGIQPSPVLIPSLPLTLHGSSGVLGPPGSGVGVGVGGSPQYIFA